ncbi:MAG: trigger factor [Sandaracinus sp.]
MSSVVTELDPVTIEVKVEVPWERVRKTLDDTYGKIQRTARVKGFRPGKAPRNVIQQLFAKDVRAEVASNLIQEGLVEAVKQHELPIVSNAQLEKEPTVAEGQPLAFSAKFEVRPKIEKLETDITLVKAPVEVTDAQVDAELEKLRQQNATIEPLETARPAKKGDVVTVDFEVTIDGKKDAEKKSEGVTVEVGDENVMKEIDAALLGASVGETKTVTVTRPDTDENKDLAGKVVVFDVVIRDLREKKIPALDDDFAKDLGEHQTLEALKKATREKLEKTTKERAESSLRQAAVDELVKLNPIPVPPSLLDQQLRAMAQEFVEFLRMIGQQPKIDEAMVGEMRGRAEQKVRAVLLLGELSRKADIKVEPADVDAKLKEIADRSGKHIAKVKVDYQGEKREQLESQILETKLVDHLLAKAKYTTEAPAPKEEAPAAKEEAKKEEKASTKKKEAKTAEKAEKAAETSASGEVAASEEKPKKSRAKKAEEKKEG